MTEQVIWNILAWLELVYHSINKIQPVDQIHLATCFINKVLLETQPHSFMYILSMADFIPQWQS